MILNKLIDKKLLKFLIVGVINTIVGTGTMFIMYNCFNFSYWVSSASNYIVGGICSFFLNKYFTFQNKEKSWKQIFKFILNLFICYFLSYKIALVVIKWSLSDLTPTYQDNIAMCVGMCLYVVSNYIGQRLFVFQKNEENHG